MSVIAKYTLPAISGSHADFPLLLKWADFSAEAISHINDGGGNLRFYSDQAGNNGLPCEVVSFDKANSKAQVYVKIPNAATGSVVYLGTDGTSQPAATDPLGSYSVWSDYLSVSHFEDNVDSVDGALWDTSAAVDTHIVNDGIIGSSYEFDGVEHPHNVISISKGNGFNDDYSISFWFTYGGDYSGATLLNMEGGNAWYSYSIRQGWATVDSVRVPKVVVYSKKSGQSRNIATLPNLQVGDRVFVKLNYSAYSYTTLTIHNGVQYASSNDLQLLNNNDPYAIELSSTFDVRQYDEPRMTLPSVVRSDDFSITEYENITSTGAWGLMEAIESAPAQEFSSNATLTLGELSINATMASAAPSFESYSHISLDEPEFQITSIGSQPETNSSSEFDAGQLSFSLLAEAERPEVASSASLSISDPSFSAQSVPVGIITASTGFEISSPSISLSMGSAKINTSSGYASIGDASFSVQASSSRPEFESSIEIDSQISISSTASSIPPQFEMYAEMEIDNLSFSTIEPTPQLDSIYVHEDAVITYLPRNNVVTYVPKNNVIRG